MLGLINRTIQFKHPEVLHKLYKSVVRVWSPQCVKDKGYKKSNTDSRECFLS